MSNLFTNDGFPDGEWDGIFENYYYKGVFKNKRYTGFLKYIPEPNDFVCYSYNEGYYSKNEVEWGYDQQSRGFNIIFHITLIFH